jgi:hypothetical protein
VARHIVLEAIVRSEIEEVTIEEAISGILKERDGIADFS